jgi:hypothetical protein
MVVHHDPVTAAGDAMLPQVDTDTASPAATSIRDDARQSRSRLILASPDRRAQSLRRKAAISRSN